MEEESFYIRQNIAIAPLINRWPAWLQLVSPVTAALIMVNKHLGIMESYIQSPEEHVKAANHPKLRGGPFIDCDPERVVDITSLLRATKSRISVQLEFVENIKALNNIIIERNEDNKGLSVSDFYELIPKSLRGYVELVYDINNNLSFRLIEPLLYKSELYDDSFQSVMLVDIVSDNRPFMMSTPMLDQDSNYSLPLSFSSTLIDDISKLKYKPRPLDYIINSLGIPIHDIEKFKNFLTTDAPEFSSVTNKNEDIRWRYFGHACVCVEYRGSTILVDPQFSYPYGCDLDRFTLLDLPETIDCVLLTHNHMDHVILEVLLELRHRIKNIVVPKSSCAKMHDPSMKLALKSIGFESVIELDTLESFKVGEFAVDSLPFFGEHCDLDIESKSSYLIRVKGKSIYFAADSCFYDVLECEKINSVYGDFDIVFIGMECDGAPLSWAYGPFMLGGIDRVADQARRSSGSNCSQALLQVSAFMPKELYIYAMGQEPWFTHVSSKAYTSESQPIIEVSKLIQECEGRGIKTEHLYAKKEGVIRADTAPR